MSGLFIAGSDTDSGKTEVAASICRLFKKTNRRLTVRKPVASGCAADGDASTCLDTVLLKTASESIEDYHSITAFAYQKAVTPAVAAEENKDELTIEDLAKSCVCADDHFLLVEGAGGIASPISKNGNNADLAKSLKLPVVFVVGSRLGCISHTITALCFMLQQSLELHSILLNDTANDQGLLLSNRAMIEKFSKNKVFILPFVATENAQDRWITIGDSLENQGWCVS